MLCEADANLARRDPEVPGLPLLLDPQRFAQALDRAYPQAQVSEVTPRYVRYKPGTNCLVAYVVRCAAGPVEAYARAHNPGTDQKLEKAAQRGSVPSALGDGIRLLPEQGVVIYPFPNDLELGALQWLDHHPLRGEMLQSVLPERPDLWDAELEPLRYKPERRFVAKLKGEAGAVVLKVYTRQDYRVRKNNIATFAGVPPLRVPRCLSRSSRYHLAALEWLDGVSLREALAVGDGDVSAWHTVGAAVARLHAQKSGKIQTLWTAESYARLLVDAAGTIAELAPELAARAQGLAGRIGEKLLKRHWRARRAIHGDLSADQVLLQDGAVGVVDFDRAAYGDPRVDLGSFGAKLECDVLDGRIAAGQAEACFAAVLDAYRQESLKDRTRRLERFVAASLLQRAVEPFRQRRHDWPQRMEAILAAAESYDGRLGD